MSKRIITIFTLILVLVISVTVYADFGPKPSIDIIAVNMPDELCYIDMLVDKDTYASSNIRNPENYDQEMLSILKNYGDGNSVTAMVSGTATPIDGDIICNVKNGEALVKFTYNGVPDEFKIIVVTKSNEIVVSNIIKRKAFQSKVYFDYETGKAYESTLFFQYLKQFLKTLTSTLAIEGIVLLLFGFSLRKNYKPFLCINIFTQILLTLVVITGMLTKGTFSAIFAYFPFEIVIIIIETVLFLNYLEGHSRTRKIVYAISANMLSFIAGVILLLSS